ncbi:type II toxin-antitoxin system VapC family toxin [Candidatus Woesearchaeota archaeon]|nr:MAG: type II toxin-antitoxin system VapC family toxin [Candidatus Woesearchaeota archaeon]
MGNPVILDTDVIIEYIKGNEQAVRFITENEGDTVFGTTAINTFELYLGAQHSPYKDKQLPKLDEFISQLLVLPLTLSASKRAAKIQGELQRKGNSLDFKDLLIGALAIEEGFALKTNNRKHFERIPGLTLI